MKNDLVEINDDNPHYHCLANLRKEKSDFLPKLDQNQKWFAESKKEFFSKIQWISAAAISLTVPLLANQKLITVTLNIGNHNFSNLFVLKFCWILFIAAFLFSLYGNKFHAEYINNNAWKQWINLELKEAIATKKALLVYKQTTNTISDNISDYSNLLKKINHGDALNIIILKSSNILAQLSLILAIIFFAIFGIMSF